MKYLYLVVISLIFFLNIISLTVILAFYNENTNSVYDLPIPNPQRLTNCNFGENHSNINTVYIRNTSSIIKCMPHEYNFSDHEARLYWNYQNYSSCSTKRGDDIRVSRDLITAYCRDGQYAYFGVDNRKQETFRGGRHKIQWEQGTRKFIGNSEFAMVKCNEDSIYSYVFNRFNETTSNRTKKVEKSLAIESKPIAVLLLVFDSISRDSAKRNLEKTIEYLKQESSCGKNISKFSIYDFKLANAESPDTKRNMLPLLYGHSLKRHRQLEAINRYKSNSLLDLQKQYSLWSHFSSLGFVTYFSVDTVFSYFAEFTGNEIQADYVFQNFWKAAQTVYGYQDHLENQRCFGNHNAHFYSMDYTYQFFKNYREHNRFGFVHITAAHEDTGNIKTIDSDLPDFLKSMFDLFDSDKEDFVLFLLADHGRGMDKLQFNIKGNLETLVPMSYIIMNRELEEKMGSRANLDHNIDRLMSRYDINLSLRSLAYIPYGDNYRYQYRNLKEKYLAKDVVNLFDEKISDTRTCADSGIPDDFCICNDFTDVNLDNENELIILDELVSLITRIIEGISINNVESVMKINLRPQGEGWDTIYKVKLSLDSGNIIHAYGNFCNNDRILKTKQILDERIYPFKAFYVGTTNAFLQISHIAPESKFEDEPQ